MEENICSQNRGDERGKNNIGRNDTWNYEIKLKLMTRLEAKRDTHDVEIEKKI